MDRVRETVFAVLSRRIVGATFLDLFAGAGTVGLEALSRGAEAGGIYRVAPAGGRCIRANAERCGVAKQATVVVAPVARGLAIMRRQARQFDIIFVDPPYDRGRWEGPWRASRSGLTWWRKGASWWCSGRGMKRSKRR